MAENLDRPGLISANQIDLSSSTSRNQPPSLPPQFEIKFKFSRVCFFDIWVSTGENSWETESLRTVVMPPEEDLVLNLRDFLVHDRARQLMGEKLSRWTRWEESTHDRWRRDCIETALEKGREAVGRMPASHNSVCIGVRVKNTYISAPIPAPDVEACMERSLERKRITGCEDSCCSICLENFSDGDEGVATPCGHVFHDDCIRVWLQIRLCCPYCRSTSLRLS